ncbi:unnamed protein product, partial [marine sediment metagenome]
NTNPIKIKLTILIILKISARIGLIAIKNIAVVLNNHQVRRPKIINSIIRVAILELSPLYNTSSTRVAESIHNLKAKKPVINSLAIKQNIKKIKIYQENNNIAGIKRIIAKIIVNFPIFSTDVKKENKNKTKVNTLKRTINQNTNQL